MSNPDVIARLKELQDASGVITPDVVLADAEDETSPLHSYFEWDDSIAGVKFRIEQARTLIRSVRLVLVEKKHQIKTVAYVRSPDAEHKEQGYVSAVVLRDDKARARIALIGELRRAESALQRAYDVAEAVGLSSEVDKLLAQIRNIRSAA